MNIQGYSELLEPIRRRENYYPLIWWIPETQILLQPYSQGPLLFGRLGEDPGNEFDIKLFKSERSTKRINISVFLCFFRSCFYNVNVISPTKVSWKSPFSLWPRFISSVGTLRMKTGARVHDHSSTSSCMLRIEKVITFNLTWKWTYFHTNSLLHGHLFLMHVHK